jgi:LacI family transcriptional regulator
MASIKDIAERAGVGVSTASRSLRGEGYVSAQLRERVQQAAQELHYLPNTMARSLRGRGTQTIGFLVYDILNPFFANLAAGVEDEAYEQGFNVIVCSSQPWKSPDRESSYMRMLLQKQIDGLILQHHFSSNDYPAMLLRQGIPVVGVVSPIADFPCDLVRCDTKQGTYELIGHLVSCGHRRIAALGPRMPSFLGGERLIGYRTAIADAGLAALDELIALEGWRTRDGYNMCNRLLDLSAPDALFAFGPRIAVGAAYALRERGLRIPEDIALVCVDDFGMGSDLDPLMTVSREPEREMGRRAAHFLVDRITKAYSGPPRELMLPATLIIRRSCGAQPDQGIHLATNELVWEDD